jgi:hypothetical protein
MATMNVLTKKNCMPAYVYTCLIFLLSLFSSVELFAQEKFEKESRIKQRDVPQKALDFIESANIKGKMKWYLEQGLNRKSIEVKFQQNRKRYSVEFDTLGTIEDVEIELKATELPASLNNTINAQLQNDCIKYKVEKIQVQYSGSEEQLLAKLKNPASVQNLVTKYEVVVKCTFKNNVELLEYLFTDTGTVLSVSTIVFKNSSHLEY